MRTYYDNIIIVIIIISSLYSSDVSLGFLLDLISGLFWLSAHVPISLVMSHDVSVGLFFLHELSQIYCLLLCVLHYYVMLINY